MYNHLICNGCHFCYVFGTSFIYIQDYLLGIKGTSYTLHKSWNFDTIYLTQRFFSYLRFYCYVAWWLFSVSKYAVSCRVRIPATLDIKYKINKTFQQSIASAKMNLFVMQFLAQMCLLDMHADLVKELSDISAFMGNFYVQYLKITLVFLICE